MKPELRMSTISLADYQFWFFLTFSYQQYLHGGLE
jgi:hypothetical protein